MWRQCEALHFIFQSINLGCGWCVVWICSYFHQIGFEETLLVNSKASIRFYEFCLPLKESGLPVALCLDIAPFCNKRMGFPCSNSQASIQWSGWPNRSHDNCMHNIQSQWSLTLARCWLRWWWRRNEIGHSALNRAYCPSLRVDSRSMNAFCLFQRMRNVTKTNAISDLFHKIGKISKAIKNGSTEWTKVADKNWCVRVCAELIARINKIWLCKSWVTTVCSQIKDVTSIKELQHHTRMSMIVSKAHSHSIYIYVCI